MTDKRFAAWKFSARQTQVRDLRWRVGFLSGGVSWKVVVRAGEVASASRRRGAHQSAGERDEQASLRTGSSERDAHAGCGFDNARADFQEAQTDRVEFGLSESVCGRNGVAHTEHQPISGGVQNQAELIGARR